MSDTTDVSDWGNWCRKECTHIFFATAPPTNILKTDFFLSFTFAAAIECCDAVVISATYHFMVTKFICTILTVSFCIGFDTASKITYFWWQLKCEQSKITLKPYSKPVTKQF